VLLWVCRRRPSTRKCPHGACSSRRGGLVSLLVGGLGLRFTLGLRDGSWLVSPCLEPRQCPCFPPVFARQIVCDRAPLSATGSVDKSTFDRQFICTRCGEASGSYILSRLWDTVWVVYHDREQRIHPPLFFLLLSFSLFPNPRAKSTDRPSPLSVSAYTRTSPLILSHHRECRCPVLQVHYSTNFVVRDGLSVSFRSAGLTPIHTVCVAAL
jgi:hypothetical protein